MGVDLNSIKAKNKKNEYIHFNWAGWRYVTNLMADNGWIPQGTVQRPFEVRDLTDGRVNTIKSDPQWDGSYFSNDGQFVTDEDAANMLMALKKGLPGEKGESKEWQDKLQKFIKFLENGEFQIF